MTPTIRRASRADAEALAALHRDVFPPGWDLAFWQEATEGAHGTMVWAAEDSGFVGLIAVRSVADEAEILTLGVAASARRQGFAAALLNAAMEALHAAGTGRLFLEVAATNAAALALYRRAGFEEIGQRRRYYADGADALVLQRTLKA